MNKNCIIAGVGGQGILTIAAIIDIAAIKHNLFVKQAEVHGMSQRGGAVESHIRISDSEIFSDLIPSGQADCIIATEPLEALRYVPFLKKNGMIISAQKPFINCDNYPEEEKLFSELKNYSSIIVDAEKLALQNGSIKATNTVILGAAAPFLDIPETLFAEAISHFFAAKGKQIVSMNISAFNDGLAYSKKN
ncbi:MAG: indolepyruvate oxidoreductase subunit beta [Bacteroidales bacterium]|jgi:indolepyruvate ferredoxin oxidoreductase beta subunit|nr:indolepyruvate oxidoreductase subunit beta [Bacteroidales bacterium]